MKKLFCTFLAIIMVMSLAACGETPSKATDKTDTANKIVEENLPSKENKGEKPIIETEVPTESLETEAVTEPTTEPVVEEVDMGATPEIINLSELTMDTTYLYHLEDIVIPEEDSFSLLNAYPQLINDTEYTVLNVIIQINDEDPKDFAAYKHTAYTYVPLADAIIEHTELKTMRLTVQYVEVDQVLDPEQTVNLSDYEENATIDMGTKNYLFNNTESTITVNSDGTEYVLLPYDILESSFTYVNTITKINLNEGVG